MFIAPVKISSHDTLVQSCIDIPALSPIMPVDRRPMAADALAIARI